MPQSSNSPRTIGKGVPLMSTRTLIFVRSGRALVKKRSFHRTQTHTSKKSPLAMPLSALGGLGRNPPAEFEQVLDCHASCISFHTLDREKSWHFLEARSAIIPRVQDIPRWWSIYVRASPGGRGTHCQELRVELQATAICADLCKERRN